MLSRVAIFFILLFGCLSISSSQSVQETIAASNRNRSTHSMPMAIYRDIKANDLKKILIDSFTESGFTLLAAEKKSDGIMSFQFSFPVYRDGRPDSIIFSFDVNGTLVGQKCMNCFLRWGQILGEHTIASLPWMTQYDLSSRLYPDIDKAYLSIKNKSWSYLDQKHGFDYTNMWRGERNQSAYDNSYINISLPDLKRELTRAFTDAGFVLLRDSNPAADASLAVLAFSFPIDSDKPEGAVYSMQLMSQFDAAGLCYPCESRVVYDPHQTLPAAGLSGMAARLTLASRFESSLNRAYDQIKASTERYLRPRTEFVRPPKSAPLGSPRPAPPPAVVT